MSNGLASATGTRINTGPTVNTTGRADAKNLVQARSDAEIKNRLFDIKTGEICVTSNHKTHAAYVPVMSTDIGTDTSITLNADAYIKLPINEVYSDKSQLDMNMATYYKDMGDARTDFELVLAYHQISLHSMDTKINRMLLWSQDKLFYQRAKDTQLSDFSNLRHRRNAIILMRSVKDMADAESEHKGKYSLLNNSTDIGIYKFVPSGNEDLGCDSKPTVYAIMCTDSDQNAVIQHDLELKISIICQHIQSRQGIKILTPKSNNTSPITPPHYKYAGIALTDACMHPQNGDTAVTINVFSAMTVDNGPFVVVCNDDLMWIHRIELSDFDVNGSRRKRLTLDMNILTNILQSSLIEEDTFYINMKKLFEMYTSYSNQNVVPKTQDAVPGNPSKKTFIIAPLKTTFEIIKRCSIMDQQRKMGRALSSAAPFKGLDIINGACPHM